MTTAAGRGTSRAASGGPPRRLARWVAVAALGVLALAVPSSASAASSCAGGGPCLVVKVLDEQGAVQSTRQFSADDVKGPNPGSDTTYRMRNGSGPVPDVVAPNPLPLTAVLGDVRLTVAQVHYAEVIGADGSSHTLTQQQLAPTPDNGFVDGLSPAVFAGNGAMNYVRPLIAGDSNDANLKDWFGILAPQPLVVLFHTSGKILHPTIAVDHAEVRAGTLDTFRATFPASDEPLPAGLTYTWLITPSERIGRGPSPWQHAWAQPGTYNVYLQVTAPDTSGGGSNSVQVVVCPQQGNTTVCTKPKPVKGPHSPGGGHEGGHHPPTGPTAGTGTHQGGHVHGTQNPQSPTANPGDATTGSGHHSSPGTGGNQSTDPSDPGRQSGHQQGGPTEGRQVSGQLLAASTAYVVPQQKPAVTAAAAPRAPTEPGWTWQWKWAAVLLLPLLIGLGMVGESLPLRRRLARMGA